MLIKIPFAEFEVDAFSRAVSGLVYVLVWATIGLYVVQLASAVMLLLQTRNSRWWGLTGSIIAVLGGLSLPVGVYGVWLFTADRPTTGVGVE